MKRTKPVVPPYARSREQGAFTNHLLPVTWEYKNAPSVTASIWTAQVGTKVGTSDVVTPDYRRLSESGVVVNNPFSTVKVEKEYINGHRAYYHNNPGGVPDGSLLNIIMEGNNGSVGHISSLQPHTIDIEKLQNLAATQALAAIDSADVQGIVFLAELKQTISTLLNPLSGMAQFLAHAAVNSKGKAGKQLANAHLATMFGVIPFLSDISSILKALHNLERPIRRTARGQSSASDFFTEIRPYSNPDCYGDITITRTTEIQMRAGCTYEVLCDLGLSQFGLNPANIPGAFWQLIPFSFLLDYLWNVSQFINSLSPSIVVVRRAQWLASRTFQHHAEVLGECIDNGASWRSGSAGGDQAHTYITEKVRIPANLEDYRALVFNPRLDVGKVLTSLSLSVQTTIALLAQQKKAKYQPAFANLGSYVFKGWNNLYISLRK